MGMVEFNAVFGVGLLWVEYFWLRTELNEIKQGTDQNEIGGGRVMSMDTFLESKVKGSKRIRRVLCGEKSRSWMSNDPKRVASLITLFGNRIEGMSRKLVECHVKLWNMSILPAELRGFLFSLAHGKLWFNYVRSRFDLDVHPACSFCKMSMDREIRLGRQVLTENEYRIMENGLPNETIRHIFWECERVATVIKNWVNEKAGENGNRMVKFEEYWCGKEDFREKRVIMLNLFTGFIKSYLYKCKMCRIFPRLEQLREEWAVLECKLRKSSKWGGTARDIEDICRVLIE
jgi:hypothetical protein